jgi:hypothetical protein
VGLEQVVVIPSSPELEVQSLDKGLRALAVGHLRVLPEAARHFRIEDIEGRHGVGYLPC